MILAIDPLARLYERLGDSLVSSEGVDYEMGDWIGLRFFHQRA